MSAATINDIINHLYNSKEYDQIIRNLINNSQLDYDLFEDIKQELYLQILDGPIKVIGIYNRGQFKWWFTRIAVNQIKSTKSRIYATYVKKSLGDEEYNDISHTNIKPPAIYDRIDEKNKYNYVLKFVNKQMKLNKESHRNFYCWKLYYINDYTMQMITNETKIPITSVYNYIREARRVIKTELNTNLFN